MRPGDSAFAIVLVNYFNDDEVLNFIRSEVRNQSLQPSILIVNNGSKNSILLHQVCNDEKIILIDPGKNTGYLGGFLLAVDYYLNNNLPLPKWFVLSNADIEIEKKDLLESVFNKAYPGHPAVVGTSIISTRSNADQNPMYVERISLKKLFFLKVVFSNQLFYSLYQTLSLVKHSLNKKGIRAGMQKVYAVHGSFLFIEGEFLKSHMKEFRKGPFLFGEELHIAEIALKYNRYILYDPSFKVFHHEHQTTGIFKSSKNLKLLKQSVEYRIRQMKKGLV